MKPLSPFAALALVLCLHAGNLRAIDVSLAVPVERYTIQANQKIKHEQGCMLANGRFSGLVDNLDMWRMGIPLEDFKPISGRLVTLESTYNLAEANNWIPRWVRSRETFYLGEPSAGLGFVIVSVRGGVDPNPIPVITTQPQTCSVLLGHFAMFEVTASPEQYLTYQWKFKGKAIAGATESYLFIDGVTQAQAGNYTVEVSAGGKPVLSKPAALKVVLPVTITTAPRSQTIKAGRPVSFRVAAGGTGPYTYQWYFAGQPIGKATKSSYAISRVSQANAGEYYVIVRNGLSWAESTHATLTVP